MIRGPYIKVWRGAIIQQIKPVSGKKTEIFCRTRFEVDREVKANRAYRERCELYHPKSLPMTRRLVIWNIYEKVPV